MSPENALRKIVLLSLATTIVFACVLIMSPLFVQLKISEAYQVVQIIFPVFAGYLARIIQPIDPLVAQTGVLA